MKVIREVHWYHLICEAVAKQKNNLKHCNMKTNPRNQVIYIISKRYSVAFQKFYCDMTANVCEINTDRTSKAYATVSMAITCFLAQFCRAPVRKACGKKNPEIQNTFGIPVFAHSCMKLTRRVRSFVQAARTIKYFTSKIFIGLFQRHVSNYYTLIFNFFTHLLIRYLTVPRTHTFKIKISS